MSRSAPALVCRLLITGSAFLFMTGCETPTSSPLDHTSYDQVPVAESYPEIQYREMMKQLRTGMTKDQVLQLISNPTRMLSATADSDGVERWIYELRHRPQFRTITAEMEEVPVVDPISGEAGVVMEARQETERFQLVETFILGFDAQGILVDLRYEAERVRT